MENIFHPVFWGDKQMIREAVDGKQLPCKDEDGNCLDHFCCCCSMSGVDIAWFKLAIFEAANSAIFISYNISPFCPQKASSLFIISCGFVDCQAWGPVQSSLFLTYTHVPTANVVYATPHQALYNPREIIITGKHFYEIMYETAPYDNSLCTSCARCLNVWQWEHRQPPCMVTINPE